MFLTLFIVNFHLSIILNVFQKTQNPLIFICPTARTSESRDFPMDRALLQNTVFFPSASVFRSAESNPAP